MHHLQLEKVLVSHLTLIPSYEGILCLKDFTFPSELESIITISYTNPFLFIRNLSLRPSYIHHLIFSDLRETTRTTDDFSRNPHKVNSQPYIVMKGYYYIAI